MKSSDSGDCPVCGLPRGKGRGNFTHPEKCPYSETSYPDLCALHDTLYFGVWRKMTAGPLEIKRALPVLKRFLKKIKEKAWEENLQPAKYNVKKAFDSLADAEALDDPFLAVRYMDRALSYAHHALNDLLHERGEKPHAPDDYERFYDVTDLPFREEM